MTIYLILWATFLIGYLIAVARIWGGNRGLAIGMLLFLPLGVYALVRYWNDGARLRVPLIASLAAAVLWLGMLAWGPRPEFIGGDPDIAYEADGMPADPGARDSDDERLRRSVKVARLPFRSGSVDLIEANATIEVPVHFRFVSAEALRDAFLGTEDEPDPTSLGWLVHESVNLAAPDAWHVDIEWMGDGYVRSDGFGVIDVSVLAEQAREVIRQVARRENAHESEYGEFVRYVGKPSWDASQQQAVWIAEFRAPDAPTSALACQAARLGRRGALVFSMVPAPLSREELCLRAVRLPAARATFQRGETYADQRMFDPKADYDLTDLVTGAYVLQP